MEVAAFQPEAGVPTTVTEAGMPGPRQIDSTLTVASRSRLPVEVTVPTKTTGAAAKLPAP
jgi:hypothetical protein